jgi:TLC domain
MFDPWLDAPGWAAGAAEFVAGMAFFPLVFYTLLCLLGGTGPGRRFCARYRLRAHGIYDICNKLTSSTFAVLACYSGGWVLARCDRSRLDERWHILDNYLIFGLSYFLYDCVSMYMVYRLMG